MRAPFLKVHFPWNWAKVPWNMQTTYILPAKGHDVVNVMLNPRLGGKHSGMFVDGAYLDTIDP